jgi:hypothetical protein
MTTYHRFVLHHRVPDYLQLGWMALPSLEDTHHGRWSTHCIWLCECRPVEPGKQAADEWQNRSTHMDADGGGI